PALGYSAQESACASDPDPRSCFRWVLSNFLPCQPQTAIHASNHHTITPHSSSPSGSFQVSLTPTISFHSFSKTQTSHKAQSVSQSVTGIVNSASKNGWIMQYGVYCCICGDHLDVYCSCYCLRL